MKGSRKTKMFVCSLIIIIAVCIIYFKLPYSPVKSEFWMKVNEVSEKFTESGKQIDEDDLKDLPEVIQKYFTRNGYLGINSASVVILDFKGADLAMGVDKPQLKIDYLEYNFVDEPARFALIDTKMYGIPFQGLDSYQDAKGSMKGIIAKHITLFDVKGTDMDQGALVTYLSECLMHPSLALQENISYEPIDEYSVKATIVDQGLEVNGIFYFNEKNELTGFEAKRYSYDTDSYERWTTVVTDYKEINGINTPTKLQAIWHYQDGELLYFNSNGVEISYQ
ncbi:DUF6544 family protein [Vallitalea okinawensis]|uniref:DUF6544 family protein n=1 Tax=Vallitalea okinawensis TaxID=2078660 RepID=UPI000CFDDCC5|nr:DUF6544 family protein [Vallitalea okinawensis]